MPVPQRASQLGGAGEQLVAGQVVADERDPTLDQPAGGEGLDDGSLAVEHLRHGADERAFLDVPSPRADRAADADRLHRLGDAIGMGDGAGFDHRRDAVLGALDRRQRGRQLVVVGGVLGRGSAPTTGRSTRPVASRSGMQLRTSGSPVRC